MAMDNNINAPIQASHKQNQNTWYSLVNWELIPPKLWGNKECYWEKSKTQSYVLEKSADENNKDT